MYLFDTNIFLEILLDQTRAVDCERAMAATTQEHPGWFTGFSLHAIEAIVGRRPTRARESRPAASIIKQFLTAIETHPFFHRYDTTTAEEIAVVDVMQKTHLDFDDALQYFVTKRHGLALVTLDRDFRHLTDIQVLDPADVK